jgi:hypothetical protein
LRDAVGLRKLGAEVGKKSAGKAAPATRAAMQPVVFRDENQTFAFKVIDAKKTVLATQGGFADPKAAMAAARQAIEALSAA